MKKPLFTAMLLAALPGGGSAFAGTVAEGYDAEHSRLPAIVYGVYGSGTASGGRVMVYESGDSGGYANLAVVCGGEASGGDGHGIADGNTVMMTGGKVDCIFGGLASGSTSTALDNKVIVTGGTVGRLFVGDAFDLSETNTVSIVGTGATYSYRSDVFVGGEIGIGIVAAAEREAYCLAGNSLDISGKDIKIGRVGSDFQILNFHLLEDQLSGPAPMVTIIEADGFSISKGLKLSFDAAEGMEWQPGTSVTLVEAQNGMTIAQEALDREYDIYRNGNPDSIVATARLVLADGQGSTRFLKLVVPGVPEPATGTLALLALAGLCARRRSK